LKTEWRDITIHKGTGILTSYDFYYNDNEFSITTSQSMNLVDTNLDLTRRFVNIQILELNAIISLNTPERGETLSIQAEVKDINDDLVEGAVVSASVGSARVELSQRGNGRYEGTIQTRDLHIGEHQIVVTAEKEGYEPGAATQTITVKTPALYIAVELPSTTMRKGGKITLNVEVKDVSNDPINGATVTSTIEEQEIVLLEKGNGEYQTKIDTKELEEGPYTIDISAEKEGYSPGISQVSVTVEKAASIPGFPYLSIIVGLLFGIFTLWLKRTR